LLQIKLNKIPGSAALLNQINKVHQKDSCSDNQPELFGNEIEKILITLEEFSDDYINEGN
jgi:hypothetical protein